MLTFNLIITICSLSLIKGSLNFINTVNFPHRSYDSKTVVHLFHDIFIKQDNLYLIALPAYILNGSFCPLQIESCSFYSWEKNVVITSINGNVSEVLNIDEIILSPNRNTFESSSVIHQSFGKNMTFHIQQHTFPFDSQKNKKSLKPISLVTMFKHEEGPEIILWIEYYFKIHYIDTFVLYCNKKQLPKPVVSYLQNNIPKHVNVFLATWPFPYFSNPYFHCKNFTINECGIHYSQPLALNSALYRLKGYAQWMLMTDLDEYLYDSATAYALVKDVNTTEVLSFVFWNSWSAILYGLPSDIKSSDSAYVKITTSRIPQTTDPTMSLTTSPTNYIPNLTEQPTLSPFINSTYIPTIKPTNNPIYPDIIERHYTFYRSPPLINLSLPELLACHVTREKDPPKKKNYRTKILINVELITLTGIHGIECHPFEKYHKNVVRDQYFFHFLSKKRLDKFESFIGHPIDVPFISIKYPSSPPTSLPSVPTQKPSSQPSIPTAKPTSSKPSLNPTSSSPSLKPTFIPSIPTNEPSLNPLNPSFESSSKPTQPTMNPNNHQKHLPVGGTANLVDILKRVKKVKNPPK